MMKRSVTHAEARTSVTDRPLDALIQRARAEFQEMPGLRLTFRQMQRLWILDRQTCHALVERLLEARVVRRTASDQYVRFDSSDDASARSPARTDLRTSLPASAHSIEGDLYYFFGE